MIWKPLHMAAATACAALLFASSLPAQQTAQPLQTMPYSPSLDPMSLDRSVDPCTDFYKFSCGGWQTKNPIPADQAAWSVYAKLTNDNQQFLWGILADDAKATHRTPVQQKVGDYFGACMDTAAIDARGLDPLKPALARIDGLKDRAAIETELASIQHTLPGSFFFGAGTGQDAIDSSVIIVELGAGGLGLPDRDYYLKTDAKSVTIREQYVAYVTKILTMAGEPEAQAKKDAATVLRIETALAQSSLSRVDRRDPHKIYHKMTVAELHALAPTIDWPVYFRVQGAPDLQTLNVSQPEFIKAVDHELAHESVEDLKGYLRFHLVTAAAPALSHPFEQAQFDFFGKTLRGVPALPPRWKTCTRQVDRNLGEALGQEFVRRTFSADMKAKTQLMTQQIETAMQHEIENLDWMSPETKKEALQKLHAIRNKIGYPDQWRDYSALTVKPDDYFGNVQRGAQFEQSRQWSKLGKPVDLNEWGMTPPTVNAYFNPQMNDINFPAGVLQPPLYDVKLDDAPNYGNTGATIGHELTHAFDDEGRQFDAKGNLKDLVDAGGCEGVRGSDQLRPGPVCGVYGGGRYPHQLQADQWRGCGGPGRDAARLHRVAEADGGAASRRRGRVYARPEVFCRDGAVGLREQPAGESAGERDHGPALAGVCADQRRGEQHARVSEGVRVQGWAADGACSGVQGLVGPGGSSVWLF